MDDRIDPNELRSMGKFYLEMAFLFEKTMKVIEENQDITPMNVGDAVKVWDGSNNVDEVGVHRSGIDPLFQNTATIVAPDCHMQAYNECSQKMATLDLKLYFPSAEIFVWTKSEHVKHVEVK